MACIDQGSADKSLDEDLRNMPTLRRHAERHRLQDVTVFHRNWKALRVFLASTSQWRFLPMGGIQSLDYAAVAAVMGMMNIPQKKRPRIFKQVRAIESGALEALSKLRNKNGQSV